MPIITNKQIQHAKDGMTFIENGLYLHVLEGGKKKYWRW
jgi:hypothetical protein